MSQKNRLIKIKTNMNIKNFVSLDLSVVYQSSRTSIEFLYILYKKTQKFVYKISNSWSFFCLIYRNGVFLSSSCGWFNHASVRLSESDYRQPSDRPESDRLISTMFRKET